MRNKSSNIFRHLLLIAEIKGFVISETAVALKDQASGFFSFMFQTQVLGKFLFFSFETNDFEVQPHTRVWL